MTILYLHGLNSKLSAEKKDALSLFGDIIAPEIPYRNDSNIINTLYQTYQDKKIDVIIGSSMGGFAGFYLSQLLQIPALLFNPALAKRPIIQNIPDNFQINTNFITILIGQEDTTVYPSDTLEFLKTFEKKENLDIEIINNLEHQIPITIFKERTTAFLNELSTK